MTHFQLMIQDLIENTSLGKAVFVNVAIDKITEPIAIQKIIDHLLNNRANGRDVELSVTSDRVEYTCVSKQIGWKKNGSGYDAISHI
jgi:hypothetical protein